MGASSYKRPQETIKTLVGIIKNKNTKSEFSGVLHANAVSRNFEPRRGAAYNSPAVAPRQGQNPGKR